LACGKSAWDKGSFEKKIAENGIRGFSNKASRNGRQSIFTKKRNLEEKFMKNNCAQKLSIISFKTWTKGCTNVVPLSPQGDVNVSGINRTEKQIFCPKGSSISFFSRYRSNHKNISPQIIETKPKFSFEV